MKRFKKIYIEITNVCNLSCSFCSKDNRSAKFMSAHKFRNIIDQIVEYTDYIYLHVKGEPLLHEELDSILTICDESNLKVNLTTNATLLKDKYEILSKHGCIRQINLSIHSENSISDYIEDVVEFAKKLSTKMFISYRVWTLIDGVIDDKSKYLIDRIASLYKLSTEIVDKLYRDMQVKIDNNTYVNKDNMFLWPNMLSTFESDGYCLGLIDQVAILVDGTVVPCCLDSAGIIKLGNVFETAFKEIIESDKSKSIIEGFRKNKAVQELCRKCRFKDRFKNK